MVDAVNSGSSPSVVMISLSDLAKEGSYFSFSRRDNAQDLRKSIDSHVAVGDVVELNCRGVDATQSFMDELVGILVLERGASVLRQLRFRGCSADMKAIINFVVSDRAAQHEKLPHFHAPR